VAESDSKLLLDIAEVSRLTGFRVGTLYRWVSERRIPFLRFSPRCVRFRRSDLEQWLAGLTQSAEQRVPEHLLRGSQSRFRKGKSSALVMGSHE